MLTFEVVDGLRNEDTATLTLFIEPDALAIVNTPLVVGTAGQPYSTTVRATGGAGPWTWRLLNGALPSGLTLGASSSNEVVVSGTPTVFGTFDFTLEVTDSLNAQASLPLTLTVNGTALPLAIHTMDVPDAVLGEGYLASLGASGGSSVGYGWSIATGRLPTGVQVSPTGTPNTFLFGIPEETGEFSFTVRVQDSFGGAAFRDFTLTSTLASTSTVP
ncbi:MAG: hypothetical protein HC923_12405 [Myxococcales bacterium]|nr:hypothetical protein [Myxococcales bacterium]